MYPSMNFTVDVQPGILRNEVGLDWIQKLTVLYIGMLTKAVGIKYRRCHGLCKECSQVSPSGLAFPQIRQGCMSTRW